MAVEAILFLSLMLLGAHWICDYPAQGPFLSDAKCNGPLRVYHLVVHAGIQGFGVALVLYPFIGFKAVWFGLAEWAVHIVIDELKIKGRTTFAVDQALHIVCKALWLALIVIAA